MLGDRGEDLQGLAIPSAAAAQRSAIQDEPADALAGSQANPPFASLQVEDGAGGEEEGNRRAVQCGDVAQDWADDIRLVEEAILLRMTIEPGPFLPLDEAYQDPFKQTRLGQGIDGRHRAGRRTPSPLPQKPHP